MSAELQSPTIHRWVDRLNSYQMRHLQLVVSSDEVLPDIADDDDTDPFLSLIGVIDDPGVPADYAVESDTYAGQAIRRRYFATS